MAELFVPKIIDQLGDVVVKQLGEKVNLLMGVEEEVGNISSKLATIEKVLHDAERRRLKEKGVAIWLEKLEGITYEMDDVLDEWNFKIQKPKNEGTHQNARMQPILRNKVCSFIPSLCSCLKQVPIRSNIASKIKKINEQLELTLKEADQYKFISSGGVPDSQDFQRIMTTSIIDESEIYGRASDKAALLDQVLPESSSQGRDRVQIISVVGAGGSGKTTLAQLLFNNDKVKNQFELRNWICVSDPFDQKRIAKAILESAGRSSHEMSELDSLIRLIKETFSSKKFLLVLDDVWTEEDSKWKPFKDSLKDGAPGSVILVTTRSLRVARVVGTTHTHPLGLISDSDCWLIMQRIAFDGRSEEWCRKVESIGQKIAEKCKGLPLAAKMIGSLLRFKDSIQQWQNILDSEIWQLKEAAVDLFPHFYLSYNELSPELKRCFSYCAVFPKDHDIDVEELIRLWIAQGYVRSNRRGECLELMGLEYFNNLAMRSFFQELEKDSDIFLREYMKCKMHDIVHDFAQFLTKDECHVLGGIDYEQGTRGNSSSERPRHLTWLGTEEMLSSPVLDIGRLRSFIALSPETVPLDLFHNLNCARTLILRDCHLRKVPAELGSLIHLRYLDLSDNPFKALPEAICDLYYLETLDITMCDKLLRLPQRIEGLVHLRHLVNYGTYELLQMPQGLGKLTSLCSLTQIIAKSNFDDLAILKDLNQLERLRIIIDGEVDFGSANFGGKIYMRELFLGFNCEFETACWIDTMEPPPNLQQLALLGYPGVQLPIWLVTESLINNLTKLTISFASNLSSLPNLWKLSSLEEVRLSVVGKLEYLGKEFFGITEVLHETSHDAVDTLSNFKSSTSTDTVVFPNLRKLCFANLSNWTIWEDLSKDDEKVDVSIMPCLEELEIVNCDMLKALPHRILGKILSLKSLEVRHCKKLRKLLGSGQEIDKLKPRVVGFSSAGSDVG
ncbi:disease resistance protein RGA2-like [Coffea arabica]|uniref:Disease resistance protein RGA2-like n=1 Tax=Coffea arabica TaxID=13443 RepID=A0ABM4U561_COFAR